MNNKSAFRVSLLLCAVIFSMLSCSLTHEVPDPGMLPDDKDSVLFPVKVNEKWGFMNRQGDLIVKPRYSCVDFFREGMIRVKLGGKWESKEVTVVTDDFLPSEYTTTHYYHQGGKWGLMDYTGRLVVKCRYDGVGIYSEGLVWVNKGGKEKYDDDLYPPELTGGKYGFIDRSGTEVTELKYDSVGDFSDGLAAVKVGDKWGFINKKGQMVIEPRFLSGSEFSEGLAEVEVGDKCGFIDRKGEMVIEPRFYEVSDFTEGLARFEVTAKDSNGYEYSKYGFIDKKGRVVIEPEFYHATGFQNGLACVCLKSRWDIDMTGWGVIDRSGNFVIAPEYSRVSFFSDDSYLVEKNNKYMFIDKNGKSLFTVKDHTGRPLNPELTLRGGEYLFDTIDCWGNGWGLIEIGHGENINDLGKFGFIDTKGTVVIAPQFELLRCFSEGLAAFGGWIEAKYKDENGNEATRQEWKWGFIDRSGNKVIEPKFDYVESFDHGLARVTIGDYHHEHKSTIGYIDREGNYVWEPTK